MPLIVAGTKKSICSVARSVAAKAEWLKKLTKNAGPKLNLLGDIVTIYPESLDPNDGNNVTLEYTGSNLPKDKARIERTLGLVFVKDIRDDYQADVKLGRVNFHITLNCELYMLRQEVIRTAV